MTSHSLKNSFIRSVVSQHEPSSLRQSIVGTDTIRISSDLETEVQIDGIGQYLQELMEEQITRVHDEASIDVPSYVANIFREQVQEETEKMVQNIEMTQVSNDEKNPVRIDVKLVHPPPDGPKATVESIAYRQKGIKPINCRLKLWSWVNQGKLNMIVIKHEFRIALIQGAINMEPDPVDSMQFGSENNILNGNDLNDEQDRMLSQEFKPNMTLSSHRSNLLDTTDNMQFGGNDMNINDLDQFDKRLSSHMSESHDFFNNGKFMGDGPMDFYPSGNEGTNSYIDQRLAQQKSMTRPGINLQDELHSISEERRSSQQTNQNSSKYYSNQPPNVEDIQGYQSQHDKASEYQKNAYGSNQGLAFADDKSSQFNQTNQIDRMYLVKDSDGQFTARQSDLGSTYLAKVQYQSQDVADVADDDDEGFQNVPQRAVPLIQNTKQPTSSEKSRRSNSRFETQDKYDQGDDDLGKQWVFDDEFEKLKDQNFNGIKMDDKSNFETDYSNWAPIPSPANHGVDRQLDKQLKDRHISKMRQSIGQSIDLQNNAANQSMRVPAQRVNPQLNISTGDETQKSMMDMDNTTNTMRLEKANQLLEQFGDDIGSDDDSQSSSSKMSDVSNEFINQLGQPKAPQVDKDVLLQYMEQQAREQLKSSLVSLITDHLKKEHNKQSIVTSLKDSIMEQVVNQDNSMIKEFKDIEIQDVDDVSINFRKSMAPNTDQQSLQFNESSISQNRLSKIEPSFKLEQPFKADHFQSYKSSFQSVAIDYRPKQYCLYCQKFLSDQNAPEDKEQLTNDDLLCRQGDHPILIINDKQINSEQFQNLMPMKMCEVFQPLVLQHPDSASKLDPLFRKPFENSNSEYKNQEEEMMATKVRVSLQSRPYDLKVLSQETGNPQSAESNAISSTGPASIVIKGSKFIKKWTVQNVGTMDWPSDGTVQVRCMLGKESPFCGYVKQIRKKVKVGERLTIALQLQAPPQTGTFLKDQCVFRVVVVAPEDKNKPFIDSSQLIFQSFEDQSLYMTLRVTEGQLCINQKPEQQFLVQSNQQIVKELKQEAVPNFFLLFNYPQYSKDKFCPNKYQQNVDKQVNGNKGKKQPSEKHDATNILSSIQKSQKQYGNNIFSKENIDKKKEHKPAPPILLDQSSTNQESYDAIIQRMESAESQFGQRCDLSLRGRVYPQTSSINERMYSLIPQMKQAADVTKSYSFERNMKAFLSTKSFDQAFNQIIENMEKDQKKAQQYQQQQQHPSFQIKHNVNKFQSRPMNQNYFQEAPDKVE